MASDVECMRGTRCHYAEFSRRHRICRK